MYVQELLLAPAVGENKLDLTATHTSLTAGQHKGNPQTHNMLLKKAGFLYVV